MSSDKESRELCGLSYRQLGKLSDEAVMAHLAGGHGDAIAVLLDRYSRLVLAIASRIVRDPSEAEDVSQEVFVDLCRTAERFDAAKGTTKMWIIRSAYRRSLTRRRDLKVRDTHLQSGLDDVLYPSAGTESIVAPKLSAYESQRLVREILDTLDAPQRRILELVYFEGLSLRDVAAKTGATLESVRHRYYRGIDKLRCLIDEDRMSEAFRAGQEAIDAEA